MGIKIGNRVYRAMALGAAVAVGALAAGTLLKPFAARAEVIRPVVADLSRHLISVTTGFTGAEVLLFGATDGPGDVVLVVRGPAQAQIVRKKEKLGGILWANGEAVQWDDVPAFLAVASSRPMDEFLSPISQYQNRMIPQSLDLATAGEEAPPAEKEEEFRQALLRLKALGGFYSYNPAAISLLPNRLFRADISLPSNVPTGNYSVEVYLIREGEVVSAEITPLTISKNGFSADMYEFAHRHSAWYGLAAIVIALASGWGAGMVFRK